MGDIDKFYQMVLVCGLVVALVTVLMIVIVWRCTRHPASVDIHDPIDRDFVKMYLELSDEGKRGAAAVARSYKDGD